MKITVNLLLTVDSDRFDLTPYVLEAVSKGWSSDLDNAAWMLAEEIAGEYQAAGLSIEAVA